MKKIKAICLGEANRFADGEAVKDGVDTPLITRLPSVWIYNYCGWNISDTPRDGAFACQFNIGEKECAAIQSIDPDKGVVEYWKLPVFTITCPGEWFHIGRDVDDEMWTEMRNHFCLVSKHEFRGYSYLDHEHVYVFDFEYLSPVKNPYQTKEGLQAYGRAVLAPHLDD